MQPTDHAPPPTATASPALQGNRVIFEQRNGGTAGTTHWLVEHVTDPQVTVPGLIRFYKANGQRKLLDQTAQWLPGGGWNFSRWVPMTPAVPKWLIQRVVEHLLQEGVR